MNLWRKVSDGDHTMRLGRMGLMEYRVARLASFTRREQVVS